MRDKIVAKVQDGKLLYHITALENMESILKEGILSRVDVENKDILQKDVANSEIIQKRKSLKILKYVPFHFFEKTPFTGTVFNNHTDTTFCTITIHRDFARRNNFKICTAHPLSKESEDDILDYDEGFAAIDWDSLEKRDYSDEKSKNVCMAECLAMSPVLPKNFHSIFVPTEEIKKKIEELATRILGTWCFHINIDNRAWCTQEGKT